MNDLLKRVLCIAEMVAVILAICGGFETIVYCIVGCVLVVLAVNLVIVRFSQKHLNLENEQ